MLKFASTFGLSQDYLAKGNIEIDKSPINQKIVKGAYYSIGKIEEKDYFQYPENVRKEGIASTKGAGWATIGTAANTLFNALKNR